MKFKKQFPSLAGKQDEACEKGWKKKFYSKEVIQKYCIDREEIRKLLKLCFCKDKDGAKLYHISNKTLERLDLKWKQQ